MYLFFWGIALLMIQPRAHAQYLFHKTHDEIDSENNAYAFTAVSCYENICTSASFVFNQNTNAQYKTFFRSTDGGETWVEQDPKLPKARGLADHFFAIQQINSLNTVAIGDSGLILRTTDGGETWVRRDLPGKLKLSDIHFSDSLTGIVTSASLIQIHTTSDGGITWVDAPFTSLAIQCHSYGNGKFRVFRRGNAKIYTTKDNWKSVDSTESLYDASIDTARSHWTLANCNFTGGDTILVYGIYWITIPETGIIIRTTDGGKSWESPFYFQYGIEWIRYSTPLDRDTVFAGGGTLNQKILISADRGKSWKINNIVLDTNFTARAVAGISLNKDGNPIIAFAEDATFSGYYGILAKGVHEISKVENYERIIDNTRIYPNPVSSDLNIISVDPLRPVHIFDMLGREVLKGVTNSEGKVTFDVSRLPRGIYDVILNHYSKMLSVGKVAIMGR